MQNNQTRGKFIVIYGINNLGKTTQAMLLVERLRKENLKAEYLKYPIYDLEPSGIVINQYLRKNNPYQLSPREAQIMYTLNRFQYEPILKNKLEDGTYVVAEDYVGTGIAWGAGAGVNKEFLEHINKDLLKEDLVLFIDGERFLGGKETNHTHEDDDELTKKVRIVHQTLAKECGWIMINANQPIDEVHERVWEVVNKALQ